MLVDAAAAFAPQSQDFIFRNRDALDYMRVATEFQDIESSWNAINRALDRAYETLKVRWLMDLRLSRRKRKLPDDVDDDVDQPPKKRQRTN